MDRLRAYSLTSLTTPETNSRMLARAYVRLKLLYISTPIPFVLASNQVSHNRCPKLSTSFLGGKKLKTVNDGAQIRGLLMVIIRHHQDWSSQLVLRHDPVGFA